MEKTWEQKTWKERQITNEEFCIGELQDFLAATYLTQQKDLPGVTIARAVVRASIEKRQEYVAEVKAGKFDDLDKEITAAWEAKGKYKQQPEALAEN